MCYEATIASAGGDDATLAKSLIISLEGTAVNWYSRLPPRCIYSWQQLKEKFLLNFQGFQAEHNTEEDFLSCAQYEKETLPNFYRRLLQWAPPHQQYSPCYPSLFPQTHPNNSQEQPPSYYLSYHYATTNHPHPSSVPQITCHPPVPQITYPTSNNTTHQNKPEPNSPLLQIREPS
jgi:hypothetical protein